MIRKILALMWLVVVLVAAGQMAMVLSHGVPLQSDLLALLPAEDQDPLVHAAKTRMAEDVSSRVVVLVGHADPAQARAAAGRVRDSLAADGLLIDAGDIPDQQAVRRLAALYFPHRAGLLAAADRQALAAGDAQMLVGRTLAQLYGIGGMTDARLLANDPFLLLPAFMTALPLPASRLTLQDGWPSVTENGVTWVLVSGKLQGQAYGLADQKAFAAGYAKAVDMAMAATPGLCFLRLGAVFYAQAGAAQAMGETSTIGLASIIGTVVLLLVVFRGLSPLLLSLLAIGSGLVVATCWSLLLFGRLHVTAAIFGASLIGITVDYSLHYFTRIFAGPATPRQRLRHVGIGLVLGLLTTLIGYGALALAPLPGLRQVAAFSVFGLIGAFLCVVLWFPLLDRSRDRPMPLFLRRLGQGGWTFWDDPKWRRFRHLVLSGLAVLGVAGALSLRVDDDVRRQQALDPVLVVEQEQVQRLAGFTAGGQFYLIAAADDETALRQEEALGQRLAVLREQGGLGDWRSAARFVPSAQRQVDDAHLVHNVLGAAPLAQVSASLGLPLALAPAAPEPLRLPQVVATGGVPALANLVLKPGVHLVALDRAVDLVGLRQAAAGLDGVSFVDPTADMGQLLGVYRQRALWLLAVSQALIVPVLIWRYGLRGGLWVMLPPLAAVVLTPPLLALLGVPFTFFAAMALVLVASVGMDYAVFCAESGASRDPVTVLATALATATTLLSFGLLAFSQVMGIRSFGAVMLVGITLAALLAPLARRAAAKTRVRLAGSQ